jgi:16S rRNA (uracil1498-N3)-methyltransferase
MPRIWVPAEELQSEAATAQTGAAPLTLEGEAHRYLTRVLRMGAGAQIDLFDGRGQEATAIIERVGPRDLTVRVLSRRAVERPATAEVTLLQGLPRPERMDLIVQKAAELGARRLIPVRAARSASGQKPRPERWERIALEAARQSGRAELMEIAPLAPLGDAVSGAMLAGAGGVRVVPWEEAPEAPPLVSLVPSNATAVAVLIGPEGGLTAEEVAAATGAGFMIATLGPRILRTETAAIAALAVIQSRVGGLG